MPLIGAHEYRAGPHLNLAKRLDNAPSKAGPACKARDSGASTPNHLAATESVQNARRCQDIRNALRSRKHFDRE